MNQREKEGLLGLLTGELEGEKAAELRRRLNSDPQLHRHYRRLEELWAELELPEPATAPIGFAARVSRAAIGSDTDRVRWSRAPIWAQATAAFALAGGVALGLGLAGTVNVEEPVVEVSDSETTLAESYWQLLDEVTGESVLEEESL